MLKYGSRFLQLSEKVLPFTPYGQETIGILSAAEGLYMWYSQLQENDNEELRCFLYKFAEINAKMTSIKNNILETLKPILSVHHSFHDYELSILTLFDKLQSMLRSNPQNREVKENDFLRSYSKFYSGEADKLYYAIMKKTLFSNKKIVIEILKLTNNNRNQVVNIMEGLRRLTVKGMELELAYGWLTLSQTEYEDLKVSWEQKIKAIQGHLDAVYYYLQSSWQEQSETEASEIFHDNTMKSNGEMAEKIYSHLSKKYNFRFWCVVIYDGNKDSKIYHCGFRCHSTLSGKTAIITSIPGTRQMLLTKSQLNFQKVMFMFALTNSETCVTVASFWGGSVDNCSAKDIAETVFTENMMTECVPYASNGVTDKSSNVVVRGAAGRVQELLFKRGSTDFLIHVFA